MLNILLNCLILVCFELIGKDNYIGNILIIIRLFIFFSDFLFIFRVWKKEVMIVEFKIMMIK